MENSTEERKLKKGDEFIIPRGFNSKLLAGMIAQKYNIKTSELHLSGQKLIYSPEILFHKHKNRKKSIKNFAN